MSNQLIVFALLPSIIRFSCTILTSWSSLVAPEMKWREVKIQGNQLIFNSLILNLFLNGAALFVCSQWSSTSSLMTVGRAPSGMWSCGLPSSWAKVSSFASIVRSGMLATTALWKMWVTDLSRGVTDHVSGLFLLAVATGQKLNGTSLSGNVASDHLELISLETA